MQLPQLIQPRILESILPPNQLTVREVIYYKANSLPIPLVQLTLVKSLRQVNFKLIQVLQKLVKRFFTRPEVVESHFVEGIFNIAQILVRGFPFLIFSVLKKGLVIGRGTYLKLSSNMRPISQ